MNYKILFLTIYSVLLIFCRDNLYAFTEETPQNTIGILTMKTFGPLNSGTVTPTGTKIYQKIGVPVEITAIPNGGFVFTRWTVEGNGQVEDTSTSTTMVTCYGNVKVTANFAEDGDNYNYGLSMAASPEEGGTVNPTEMSQVKIGQPQPISATPNATYRFIRWITSGLAFIEDEYSQSTNIFIKGQTEVTAIFAKEAEALTLQIKTDDGDEIIHEGTFYMRPGESRRIKTEPIPEYIFVGWQVEGGAILANANDFETDITLTEDAMVTAIFRKSDCTYSFHNPGRKIFIQSRKNYYDNAANFGPKKQRDKIILKKLPMCLSPFNFNPQTDTILVKIGKYTFTINKDNGIFKRNRHGYKYKATDKSFVKLVLNFTKGIWSFKAKGSDYNDFDATKGLEITLLVNDSYSGSNYKVDEKFIWTVKENKNDFENIESGGTEFHSFNVKKIFSKIKNKKENKDVIHIKKSALALPSDSNIDIANQLVTVNIGNETITIPPGSFVSKKSNVYVYHNKEQNIKMTIDLARQTWSFKYSKFSGWRNIESKGHGIDVYVTIGEYQSGLKLDISYKKQLKYNYKKFCEHSVKCVI